MLYERPVLNLLKCKLQLLTGVHHDRAVPGHWLSDRLARDEQEPNRLTSNRNGNMVAVFIQADATVPLGVIFASSKYPCPSMISLENGKCNPHNY